MRKGQTELLMIMPVLAMATTFAFIKGGAINAANVNYIAGGITALAVIVVGALFIHVRSDIAAKEKHNKEENAWLDDALKAAYV